MNRKAVSHGFPSRATSTPGETGGCTRTETQLQSTASFPRGVHGVETARTLKVDEESVSHRAGDRSPLAFHKGASTENVYVTNRRNSSG